MDGRIMYTVPPKCEFLTQLILNKIFAAICSRCNNNSDENNDLSITEFSNNKIFMIFHAFIQ